MISHEEQQLRDSKFLTGQFPKPVNHHNEVVQGWEDGHTAEEIAAELKIPIKEVEFELNVEAQMRGWHG